MPRFVQLAQLCLLSLLVFPLASAAPSADPTAAPVPNPPTEPASGQNAGTITMLKEGVLRMTEFFDTMLPGTLGAHNLTFHFNPKFSDFRDRKFVRYPFEVRYGASDRLELTTGLTPFGPNPFNNGRDHRWGPGEARLGGRYDLGGPIFFYDKATIGLDNRIPIGKPPIDLNDHYTHVRPWLATSRTLRTIPDTTFYTNFSYDRSVKLTTRNPPPPEVTRRHVFEIAPGLLYKPGEFGYFGEYRFRHIQEPTNWHLGHEFLVGSIWDVPLWRSADWKLPGKWQVELAYRVTTEEGHPLSQGVSARVNWKTTLREVLNHVEKLSKTQGN